VIANVGIGEVELRLELEIGYLAVTLHGYQQLRTASFQLGIESPASKFGEQ
jgi:hypothetical protein